MRWEPDGAPVFQKPRLLEAWATENKSMQRLSARELMNWEYLQANCGAVPSINNAETCPDRILKVTKAHGVCFREYIGTYKFSKWEAELVAFPQLVRVNEGWNTSNVRLSD